MKYLFFFRRLFWSRKYLNSNSFRGFLKLFFELRDPVLKRDALYLIFDIHLMKFSILRYKFLNACSAIYIRFLEFCVWVFVV